MARSLRVIIRCSVEQIERKKETVKHEEDTFRRIASTAKGSVIAFDYFTTEPLESQSLYWRYGRTTVKAAGEPWKFGIDSTPPTRERLAELIQPSGLSLVEQRTLGQETEGQRAWGGFAIAVVK